MSPEHVRGGRVDKRSDIFSLGAMLYWMCTGQKPFPGDSATTITFKVVFLDPAPARQVNPDLPGDLETILSRCLAKDPDQRYGTARDLDSRNGVFIGEKRVTDTLLQNQSEFRIGNTCLRLNISPK